MPYPLKNGIIHESPAMAFIAAIDTKNIHWCNRTMEDILGYTLREMQQMGDALFQTIMHPADSVNAMRARDFFLKGRSKHNATCRFKGKNDTKYRWFYGTSKAHHYDIAGNLETIFCTFLELDETDASAEVKAALNRLLHKSMEVSLEKLTPAENEILPYFAEGLNNTEIGGLLFKSALTVETHVKHIKIKLDVHSRAELIALLKLIGY